MDKNNEAKGYYTEQGKFIEYYDVKKLIVWQYEDVSYSRISGFWIDNNGHVFDINGSAYDVLMEVVLMRLEKDEK